MKCLAVISVEGWIPHIEKLMVDTEENREKLLKYLKDTTEWQNETPKSELCKRQLYFNQEEDGNMENAVQLDVVDLDEEAS